MLPWPSSYLGVEAAAGGGARYPEEEEEADRTGLVGGGVVAPWRWEGGCLDYGDWGVVGMGKRGWIRGGEGERSCRGIRGSVGKEAWRRVRVARSRLGRRMDRERVLVGEGIAASVRVDFACTDSIASVRGSRLVLARELCSRDTCL